MYFYKKICSSELPSNAVNVYKAMLQYANRETWSCFPSIKTLVRDTKLSKRTIQRQMNILEKEGYIIRIFRKRKDNGNTSNMYFFN